MSSELTPHIPADFESLDQARLKNVYDQLQEALPEHSEVIQSVSLLDSLKDSSATPFAEVDTVRADKLSAEYSLVDNVIYPDTIVIQVHGFYGDTNEVSLYYTLTHDRSGSHTGFVYQAYPDPEAYELASTAQIPDFLRTVAGQYENFAEAFSRNQPGFSVGDYKRTADLRQLDSSDLGFLAEVLLQQSETDGYLKSI